MKRDKSFKIEIIGTVKILLMICLILPVLSACRSDAERLELTNYTGSSVKNFQRKTGTELVEESNGVYRLDGLLQLIAPKGEISSITVMKEAQDYTLFGVKNGMNKSEAELKLSETYGAETSKTINSINNTITYSYIGEENELYISYGIDTNVVEEMSYYFLETPKEKADRVGTISAGELITMIGDTRVYYNEAMVYLKSVQANYEDEYGKDIWNVDITGEGKSFGDKIKEEVLKQITELKIIRDKAEEFQVTLAEEELAEAKAYARDHYTGLTDEDIDRYLITEELLEQVYADNLLAEKLFETITINDVDTNVSDLEAKQITIQHILVRGTDVDDTGNQVPLEVNERQKALEKVNNLLQQAKETDDFYALAEANSEADVIEYTFGRGQGPEEYSDAFEQAAFTLKTGEIGNIITTDYGWHILYCVTDFNEDATTQVKENIIEGRRTELFSKLYSDWSSAYEIVVNNEAWNAVSFDE